MAPYRPSPSLLGRLRMRHQLQLAVSEPGSLWGLGKWFAVSLALLGRPTASWLSIFATWPTTTHNCRESCPQTAWPRAPRRHRDPLFDLLNNEHQGVFISLQVTGGDSDGHRCPNAFWTPLGRVFRAPLGASQSLRYRRVTWESCRKRGF